MMRRLQQTKHALGSTAQLTLVLDADMPAQPLFTALWHDIDAFEQRFSRFREDSELSQFNAAAGTRQEISPAFRDLLATAKRCGVVSGDLYNPFTLPALQRAGYKGSWPHPQKASEQLSYEDRHAARTDDIQINATWACIPADTALDFGGIGKGYLLDQLADLLTASGITNYWLSLGGDIICAGYDAAGDSWRVGIQHARQTDKAVAFVRNDGDRLAIATSGTTKRQGIAAQGPWHHLIDPRTGRPADTDVLTATVCGANATKVDVAAKCLVIAGSDEVKATLKYFALTDALLQTPAGSDEVTVVKIGGIWA